MQFKRRMSLSCPPLRASRHPLRALMVMVVCPLVGCTAPIGASPTAEDAATGKGDNPPPTPTLYDAGAAEPPGPGETQAAVYEENFQTPTPWDESRGLYKGHTWTIKKTASVVHLRIDTFGTFTPDVQVNGQVYRGNFPISVPTRPSERPDGTHELVLFLENNRGEWWQEPIDLVIKSREANGERPSSDAHYRLEFLPLGAWSKLDDVVFETDDNCDEGCDGPTDDLPMRASSIWTDEFPVSLHLNEERELFVSDVRGTSSPALHAIQVAERGGELTELPIKFYKTWSHVSGYPTTDVDAHIGKRVHQIEIRFDAEEEPFELFSLDVHAVDLEALAEELPGVPVYNFAELTGEGEPSVLNVDASPDSMAAD